MANIVRCKSTNVFPCFIKQLTQIAVYWKSKSNLEIESDSLYEPSSCKKYVIFYVFEINRKGFQASLTILVLSFLFLILHLKLSGKQAKQPNILESYVFIFYFLFTYLPLFLSVLFCSPNFQENKWWMQRNVLNGSKIRKHSVPSLQLF